MVASLQILFPLMVLSLATMAGGQPKAHLKCSQGCTSFHRKIDVSRIKSYRWTEPQCTRRDPAIIFTTKRLLEICANPEEPWVMEIMQKLDQKKALAASLLPQAATSTAALEPEEQGVFHKHTGLQVPTPPQATAISEADRESLSSPVLSTTAVGRPSPYPTAPARGSDSTEETVGFATTAAGDVQDAISTSNSDPTSISKGLDRPGLPTNDPLSPVSASGGTSGPALSFSSALPSTLSSAQVSTVPSTPDAPVPTQNPSADISEGPSVHANKNFSSSAFGTGTFDHLLPLGKKDPPDSLVFTSQMFSGQASVQATRSPGNLPAPSLSHGSQAHFVLPVTLAGGLIACSVAAVWLYTKFGIRPETKSREMVQGLLYQKDGHHDNVYPMEVI
ncbi:mucin-2-like [Cyrtonyx montezumae]|uniref:mucin-2-like n=1 Tax=Cyrtonyx montezumae TaxID=9017 RepID=UPI0032DB14EC